MKKKKILVTGSAGFIGSHLIPVLKKKYHVIEWDKIDGDDIFDADIEPVIRACDIVIHLAAQVSVGNSFKDPGETYRINVLGTARIIELCIEYNKKLIFPSSAAVAYPELSPYAKSKKYAEDLVVEAMKSIPAVVLRFYNVYGKGMNQASGSIMYRFLTDKEITIYGDGEQTRDFVNVKDIVNIIVDSIRKKWNGKVVEVGTGESYSANYIAGLFAHYRDIDVKYQAPRREIKWSVANTQMLKTLYKKKLTTNLDKDVKALCRK